MKSSLKKVVLGSTTVLAAGIVGQAKAASDNVPINAEVRGAISLTQTQALNFGVLTDNGGAGGTATVDNADGITGTAAAGGTVTSGGFEIKTTIAAVMDVTTPASVSITHATNGAVKMVVNAFTIDGAAAPVVATQVAATDSHALGATITVAAGQLAGTYSGSVAVTANYQ